MTIDTSTESVQALLEDLTPGPWWVCKYDAGDKSWYDHNGPCPSIQAPDDQDCAIVHWDGFKQKYWSACNGNQKQIEANAHFIAAARDLVPALLAERDRVAKEWAEVSQRNYQRAKAAEAERDRLATAHAQMQQTLDRLTAWRDDLRAAQDALAEAAKEAGLTERLEGLRDARNAIDALAKNGADQ